MGENRKSPVQIGKIFQSSLCGPMLVIEVLENNKAQIKFLETGHVKVANKSDILRGKVKDPYRKYLFNEGFYGEGPFSSKKNPADYIRWFSMIRRCYDKANSNYLENYHRVSVEDYFKNFQNFCFWSEAEPGSKLKGWQLDKDVLSRGKLTYSRDTCCFLPKVLNLAVIAHRVDEDFKYGTYLDKKLNKYVMRVPQEGKSHKYYGLYETFEEAKEVYIEQKSAYVRKLAEIYKEELREDVYEALIDWKVS